VRYSISVPNFAQYADPRATAELARSAEAAGWDGFFVWDHLLVFNGNVVGDPWTILAAVASATERIRIGTMLTPLPRRRPWQVTRQAVTLDHLSGGRVTLGVGLGVPVHEDFEMFGEEPDARIRAELLDEGLDVLTGAMSGEPVRLAGRHYRLDGVEFAPRPVQRPRIPIWVGGAWPNRAPMRRAARYDGVVPIVDRGGHELPTIQEMREIVAYTTQRRTSAGPFDAVFTGWMPEDAGEAADMAAELASFGVTWWQVGPDRDERLDEVRAWIERGPPPARGPSS
jgi:alkanesulfonate monooxygenase SsuD/methylene tetrahydromethanopterin reductase-like flavin-dependent oxidoreductase (luciferase family)